MENENKKIIDAAQITADLIKKYPDKTSTEIRKLTIEEFNKQIEEMKNTNYGLDAKNLVTKD